MKFIPSTEPLNSILNCTLITKGGLYIYLYQREGVHYTQTHVYALIFLKIEEINAFLNLKVYFLTVDYI